MNNGRQAEVAAEKILSAFIESGLARNTNSWNEANDLQVIATYISDQFYSSANDQALLFAELEKVTITINRVELHYVGDDADLTVVLHRPASDADSIWVSINALSAKKHSGVSFTVQHTYPVARHLISNQSLQTIGKAIPMDMAYCKGLIPRHNERVIEMLSTRINTHEMFHVDGYDGLDYAFYAMSGYPFALGAYDHPTISKPIVGIKYCKSRASRLFYRLLNVLTDAVKPDVRVIIH